MPIKVKKRADISEISFSSASKKTLDLLKSKGFLTTRQLNGLLQKDLSDDEQKEIIDSNKNDQEFVAILGDFIAEEEFQALGDVYKASKRRDIPNPSKPGEVMGDSNSCWFELSEIRDFLIMNKLDLANPVGKGVRIYFGRHLFNDKTHPNFQTVILVPTVDKGKRNPVGKVIQDDEMGYISVGGGPYNHGTLCPPDDICP